MPYNIDLHTHSIASADGSLKPENYQAMLKQGKLHCIAVTDHNTIDMAVKLHAKYGDRIIVGEEITTLSGEIIGLFLQQVVPPNLPLHETLRYIREQNGLVYVPHPFETVRSGITAEMLEGIATEVDIIETHNGRAVFQNYGKQAQVWSVRHRVAGAASSDTHGRAGWGRTYTVVDAMPSRDTLVALLREARQVRAFPGLRGIMYPKLNRLRKRNAKRHAK